MVENSPANAEDTRGMGLAPGLESSPEEVMATQRSLAGYSPCMLSHLGPV